MSKQKKKLVLVAHTANCLHSSQKPVQPLSAIYLCVRRINLFSSILKIDLTFGLLSFVEVSRSDIAWRISWLQMRENKMFSYNFVKNFTFVCVAIVCAAANEQPSESIVFPTQFLRSDSLRAFDLLSMNAVSSESVVELSRASEAFSLEYFQVIDNKIMKKKTIANLIKFIYKKFHLPVFLHFCLITVAFVSAGSV